MASQRRSARVPVPKRYFDDITAILPPKKHQKRVPDKPEPPSQEATRLDASVVVASEPVVTARAPNKEPTTPPPIPVEFEDIKIHWEEREAIDLFIRFLSPQSLLVIVQSTNTRAAREIATSADSTTT